MAINQHGKVYSSSCDGQVHFMLPPYGDESVQELFRCDDAIQAMYCDGSVLYTGDDKGVVTTWTNDRMLFKYSLVEEVKSLAGEQNLIYTVRDLDVVVSQVAEGKSGKYSNKAVIPGKSPLHLLGPMVDGKRSYLAFPDRSGMGLQLVNNLSQLQEALTLGPVAELSVGQVGPVEAAPHQAQCHRNEERRLGGLAILHLVLVVESVALPVLGTRIGKVLGRK